MKFSRSYQPRRNHTRKPRRESAYISSLTDQLYELLANAKTEEERRNIEKAYAVSIRP